MPYKKLQSLHVSVLEDLLPVGMAILVRAKDGGPDKVFEGLLSSKNPIEKLRGEGLSSAKLVREKLDNISPGLGHPAFEVQVNTDNTHLENNQLNDESLKEILGRIDERLSLLKSFLD